jgi:hypothetical protein
MIKEWMILNNQGFRNSYINSVRESSVEEDVLDG